MSGRSDILGVLVDKVDMVQAEKRIAHFARSGQPHQIVTVNLDFISKALHNPSFLDLINSSSLVVADGMAVVWASKLLGDVVPQRITGTDLVNSCCRSAQKKGHGVFLFGGAPNVASEAARMLRRRFPDLRVAGAYSPPLWPFSTGENQRMVDLVRRSGARYLFVALGAPRQEFWIRENLAELEVPVCMGVGGVFNYLTGRVRQAPRWLQNLGGEWFFRMIQEPDRLAKRYLVDDLPVLLRVMSQRMMFGGAAHYGQQKRLRIGQTGRRQLEAGAYRLH